MEASIQSEAVIPVDLNGSTDTYSATFIRPLTCSYTVKAEVRSPFPQKEPTYPKLMKFHAAQPDYKEYCDPLILQNPGAFQVSVDESNPCFHTFNAQLVKGMPELKGISEGAFWSCAHREALRQYTGGMSKSAQEKSEYEVQKVTDVISDISLALQVVSGIAGMIPWGSYAAPAEKGTEKTEKVVEKNEKKVAEKAVEEDAKREQKILNHEATGHFYYEVSELSEEDKKMNEMGMRAAKLAKQEKDILKGLQEESKYAKQLKRSQGLMGQFGAAYTKYGKNVDSFIKALAKGAKLTNHLNEQYNKAKQKETAKKLQKLTVPSMDGPKYKDTAEMTKTTWNDCLPLQFGLSKVMCDLFCVQDSVRQGTSAILSSLEDSQNVLMKNLQALLNYQTEYILWAIGSSGRFATRSFLLLL